MNVYVRQRMLTHELFVYFRLAGGRHSSMKRSNRRGKEMDKGKDEKTNLSKHDSLEQREICLSYLLFTDKFNFAGFEMQVVMLNQGG